jgi:hypothetical protein
MTTSQTGFLAEINSGGEAPVNGQNIPVEKRAYFHERLKGRIYSLITKELLRQQKSDSALSQAAIAKRLNKRPEQITRWLSGPQNYTIETISDLLLAICASELSLAVTSLAPPAIAEPPVLIVSEDSNIVDISKSPKAGNSTNPEGYLIAA